MPPPRSMRVAQAAALEFADAAYGRAHRIVRIDVRITKFTYCIDSNLRAHCMCSVQTTWTIIDDARQARQTPQPPAGMTAGIKAFAVGLPDFSCCSYFIAGGWMNVL